MQHGSEEVGERMRVEMKDEEDRAMPCACAAVRMTARAVTQLYDLVLAPTRLKATQFIILKSLYDYREISQCDFSRTHAVAVETLSRRLGGLRQKGYIQGRIGTRHGERLYSLTDAGREAFVAAVPFWQRAQRRLRTALGEADWRVMLNLSNRIRNAALEAEQLRTENVVRPTQPHPGQNPS